MRYFTLPRFVVPAILFLVLAAPASAQSVFFITDDSPDGRLVRADSVSGFQNKFHPGVNTSSVLFNPKEYCYDKSTPIFLVANNGNGTLGQIDALTGAGLGALMIGGSPYGCAINNSDTLLYLTDDIAGELLIFDLGTQMVTTVIAGLTTPRGVELDPTETRAYVVDAGTGELVWVDVDLMSPGFGTITTVVGGLVDPTGLALNAAGTHAYVTETSAGAIQEIELGMGFTTPIVASGLANPRGIVLREDDVLAFVAAGDGTTALPAQLVSVVIITGVTSSTDLNVRVPHGIGRLPDCPVVTVTACPESSGAGSTVTYCVHADFSCNPDGLGSYGITLDWDTMLMTYVDSSGGTAPFDTPVINTNDVGLGMLHLSDADASVCPGNWEFTSCFTGTPLGDRVTVPVNVTVNSLFGCSPSFTDYTPVAASSIGRADSIECIFGDSNGDLALNSGDALVDLSYEIGQGPYPVPLRDQLFAGCSDANGDGVTDSVDANILLTFEVGLPVDPMFPLGLNNTVTESCPGGCNTPGPGDARFRPGPEGSISTRLVSAPGHPRPGNEFVLTVGLDAGASPLAIGSYGARLRWDPDAVEFLGTAPATTGNLRSPKVNTARAARGEIRFADANPNGEIGVFDLVEVRFLALRALPPGQMKKTFDLDFTSLGAVGPTFENLLPVLADPATPKGNKKEK